MVTARAAVSPLLFLPGRLCDARLFSSQVAALGELTQVQVGDMTGADSLEQLAQTVLDAAPDHFALVGLSLGGIVALEIVRQAPARVTRLALLDSNPGGNTLHLLAEFEAQISQARADHASFLRLTTDLFYPQMVHPARLDDPALCETVVAMALAVDPAAFVRQNLALQKRRARWNDLPRINCPTLVLSGRQDRVCPLSIQAEMARLIPQSRQEIIEECGHLSTLEQPQAVTALLRDWLLAEV